MFWPYFTIPRRFCQIVHAYNVSDYAGDISSSDKAQDLSVAHIWRLLNSAQQLLDYRKRMTCNSLLRQSFPAKFTPRPLKRLYSIQNRDSFDDA